MERRKRILGFSECARVKKQEIFPSSWMVVVEEKWGKRGDEIFEGIFNNTVEFRIIIECLWSFGHLPLLLTYSNHHEATFTVSLINFSRN
jgi:hypothetical protein